MNHMHLIHGRNIYHDFVRVMGTDFQGWNSRAPILAELVATYRPRTIIDVGVWKGGSTLYLAEALRDSGIDGCVIAVDTFLGSPEHWEPDAQDLPERLYGRPRLYEQFLSNVVRSGLQGYIVPLPQTSVNAAAILLQRGIGADLVHIDAAHDYRSVAHDAITYWTLLNSGGWLVGDDYHSACPGVVQAAQDCAANTRCELVVNEESYKWMVRKP